MGISGCWGFVCLRCLFELIYLSAYGLMYLRLLGLGLWWLF